MKTTLEIQDDTRTYTFVLEYVDNELVIYIPEYCPEAYGKHPIYRLLIDRWMHFGRVNVLNKDFVYQDAEPIPRFRYEGRFYSQKVVFKEWNNQVGEFYVSLNPVKEDGIMDIDYVGSQGSLITTTEVPFDIYILGFDNHHNVVMGLSKDFFKTLIKYYQGTECNIVSYTTLSILDDEDIYYSSDPVMIDPATAEKDFIKFSLEDIPYKTNEDYKEGLYMRAIMHFEFGDDPDNRLNMAIRTAPWPLTWDNYVQMIAAKNNQHKINIPENMNINTMRIVSKTEQVVAKMTAETDSKANIIQPVFFKVRDLAQIVVHPDVTENICINLDAYKSQVERFSIKIDGAVFSEIGRVEQGIIFKVKGNLLGGSSVGVYYILNENNDLVTTGKYIYDR